MPYVVREGGVYRKDTGKLVGKSSNPKKYLRVLQAAEHGWKASKRKKEA